MRVIEGNRMIFWDVEVLNEAKEEFDDLSPRSKQSFLALLNRLRDRGPFDLGKDKTRPIRGRIWELKVSADVEVRALYTAENERMILLLVFFIKKTQKTPLREIEKAEARYKKWRADNEA